MLFDYVRTFFWRGLFTSVVGSAPLIIRFIMMLGSSKFAAKAKPDLVVSDLQLFWMIFSYGLSTILAMAIPLMVRITAERLGGYDFKMKLSDFGTYHTVGLLMLSPLGIPLQLMWIVIVGLYTFAFWLFRRDIAVTGNLVIPVLLYAAVLTLCALWPYIAYTGGTSWWLGASALELLITFGVSVATTVLFWIDQGSSSGITALVASVLILGVLINNLLWWYAYSQFFGGCDDNDEDDDQPNESFFKRGWKQLKSDGKLLGSASSVSGVAIASLKSK